MLGPQVKAKPKQHFSTSAFPAVKSHAWCPAAGTDPEREEAGKVPFPLTKCLKAKRLAEESTSRNRETQTPTDEDSGHLLQR